MVKTKVGDWVDRNFFSLTVFGGNLLVVNVYLCVTMDRHIQACQWTSSISLLTWYLLWASACSLEAWRCSPIFLRLHSYHNPLLNFKLLFLQNHSKSCWSYLTTHGNFEKRCCFNLQKTPVCRYWKVENLNYISQFSF